LLQNYYVSNYTLKTFLHYSCSYWQVSIEKIPLKWLCKVWLMQDSEQITQTLNLVDYNVCGIMQLIIYQTKVKILDNSKHSLTDVLAVKQQSFVDYTINQWDKHLHASFHDKGRHFQHSPHFANFYSLHFNSMFALETCQ